MSVKEFVKNTAKEVGLMESLLPHWSPRTLRGKNDKAPHRMEGALMR
jgi:hypothetical protein